MNISKWILDKTGWKLNFGIGAFPEKCIVCVAPHTSNWDFIIGELICQSLNEKAGFLIKKSWTVFPFSLVFKPLGAIPVDRSKKTSVTEQVIAKFNESKKLIIAVTPEGTRKKNAEWKKGFYYIAQGANVPIVLASIDYSKKLVEINKVFNPTGDMESDMKEIQSYYKGVTAKKPENFAME